MLSLSGNLAKVIVFSPKHWGEVVRFGHFYSSTYTFDERTQHALHGVNGHFQKAMTLLTLAHSIAPNLKLDREEERAKGFASNTRSAELAALLETVLCELYSSVDCGRQVIGEIFKSCQGVTSKSTRRLFQNAFDGKLDPKLPTYVRESLEQATWFNQLRMIRDAIIHSNVGSCHFDSKDSKVRYLHSAVSVAGKPLMLDDVFTVVDGHQQAINKFLGTLFRCLNETLKDTEVWQICGFFNGRAYTRFVKPSDAVDFHGGKCDAHTWFDLQENPRCPFADECGAYKRAKTELGKA